MRCTESTGTGSSHPRATSGGAAFLAQAATAAVLLGCLSQDHSKLTDCSGMWAGRLRQDGNAFAALGPARRNAMLTGGSTTQRGKGKGKPVAADPIVPTKSNSRKTKGVNSACPRDPCAGSSSESNKGKGKRNEAAKMHRVTRSSSRSSACCRKLLGCSSPWTCRLPNSATLQTS